MLYGKDQEKAAKNDAKELDAEYGTVHLIFGDTAIDFFNAWQAMGVVNGHSATQLLNGNNVQDVIAGDGTVCYYRFLEMTLLCKGRCRLEQSKNLPEPKFNTREQRICCLLAKRQYYQPWYQ